MVLVDELPPENSRRKKWFWRIFKILCVLAVMFTIGLVILSRLGGNNDNLRAGLESLIGGAAGDYPARVGRLHGLSFFPFIRVYADDISIMPRPGTADTEQPLMTVGTIMFSRGFWDSFFWKNRIEGIRVENIDITADFITPRALIDGHIEMGPESFENTPGLLFTGTYGSQKFEWRMGLTLQSRNLRPVYSLSEAAPVTFVIGDVKAKGKIVRPHGGGVSLQIDELSVPGHTEIDVKGAIKIVRSASLENYEVSLITTNSNVAVSYKDGEDIDSLTIAAEKLARSEIRPLLSLLSALQDIYKEDTPGIDLGDIKKISLKIENLHDGAKDWGYFDLSGTVDDAGLLTVNDLKGRLIDGALFGKFTLDTAKPGAQAGLDIKLDDFDYAQLQGENSHIDGRADLHLKLNASGQSFDALLRGMNGEVILLGGAGQMTSDVINVWGEGLLSSMLPDIGPRTELTVNCVMMHLDVKNSMGTVNPFLLDTQSVTVAGEGTVDLYNSTLDMIFTPDAKGGIPIGNITAAVRVRGPWQNPTVGADAFSLGKTLGKLLIGTINPALWAWSLTDIGVNESHPCRAYLKEAAAE